MIRESVSSLRRRSLALFTAVFAITLFLLIIGIYKDDGLMELGYEKNKSLSVSVSVSHSHSHRKLLISEGKRKEGGGNEKVVEPNRIWSDRCSKSDIVISQGATEPLPNGIPTYTVEIMNTCVSGCDITAIHLSCGWFSSARLVNPHVFKRLRFGDCLVNDGKPLRNGRTLSFQYANTFRYPLSVSSVSC